MSQPNQKKIIGGYQSSYWWSVLGISDFFQFDFELTFDTDFKDEHQKQEWLYNKTTSVCNPH